MKTWRQKLARSLRKWADLIDPRTAPQSRGDEMRIALSCDTSEFDVAVSRSTHKLVELNEAMKSVRVQFRADYSDVKFK